MQKSNGETIVANMLVRMIVVREKRIILASTVHGMSVMRLVARIKRKTAAPIVASMNVLTVGVLLLKHLSPIIVIFTMMIDNFHKSGDGSVCGLKLCR